MSPERATRYLIGRCFTELDRLYGQDSPNPKQYYTVTHAIDAWRDGGAIAKLALKRKKISPDDLIPLNLALVHHDLNKDLPPGEAEADSAESLMKRMYSTGAYNMKTIERAGSFIIATTAKFIDGKFVQTGGDDYASLIMPDGDVASLGKPFDSFMDRTMRLFSDQMSPKPFIPDKDFYVSEANFLRNHTFFTEEADEIFKYKPDNIRRLDELAEAV